MTRVIDMTESIAAIKAETEHHFLYIEQKVKYDKSQPIKFEMSYADYRTIQLGLYWEHRDDLLEMFTQAYKDFYKYDSIYSERGQEAFDVAFSDKLTDFKNVKDQLLSVLSLLEQAAASEAGK